MLGPSAIINKFQQQDIYGVDTAYLKLFLHIPSFTLLNNAKYM